MLAEELLLKYEILETLSHSYFSTVYLARQKSLDRKVVIKVIAPQIANDETAMRRFVREAKILADLDDPGVVKIYDFGRESGFAFLVSEFVEGETLEGILEREKKLDPREVLRIGKSIAETLSRIHKEGIFHRDIKPSNILLKRNGEVKLTDFGLARSSKIGGLTIEGEIIGTPAYMSPEQISGRPIDHRSDIFSFGVVLYELLTGENPFSSETYSAVLHKVLNYKPTIENFPIPLANLLEGCLEKRPEKRFSDFNEVSEKIEEAMKELVELGDDDSGAKAFEERSAPFLFRSGSLIPALVALFGFILFFLFQSQKARLFPKRTAPLESIPSVQERLEVKGEGLTDTTPEGEPPAKVLTTLIFKKEREEFEERGKRNTENGKWEDEGRVESQKRVRRTAELTDSGYLSVNSEPWSNVYIYGENFGQTPLFLLKLLAKETEIKFFNPEFGMFETVVRISPKETTRFFLDFKSHFAGLKLFVEPWANVYIDGEYKETTPIEILYLSPGRHELKLLNPNFSPYLETLEFKAGEIKERRLKGKLARFMLFD